MSLDDLRVRLDAVDRDIVRSVAERMRIVEEVAALKRAGSAISVRDLQRESSLLAKVVALAREEKADTLLMTRLYRVILETSVRAQQVRLAMPEEAPTLKVVYQGVEGAYSSLAARAHFASRTADVTYEGLSTFRAILTAVHEGHADYAVLPIENTTAGSINQAYDLLASMDLAVVGEEIQRVDHCLLALAPDARPTAALSHPQALAQCSDWLSQNGVVPVVWEDTAGACAQILEEGDPTKVAIASAEAGERFGLHVIARGIANQTENYTRMVIVAAEPVGWDMRIPCKTSLVFATRHEEGALLKALNVLADHHLNLTKLESRPRMKTPWEYTFYVDFEGNLSDPVVQQAVDELVTHTSYMKILGSYPSRTGRENRPARPLPVPVRGARARSVDAVRHSLRDKNYARVSRLHRPADTHIMVKDARFGGPGSVVVAGPADWTSLEDLWDVARAIQASGGDALSLVSIPDGCEQALMEVAEQTGLALMMEVLDGARLGSLARLADILRVRARDMEDVALLRQVGRVDRPVVLERGHHATVDQWLEAAEIILEMGNQQVILCDTGVKTVVDSVRPALDLGAIQEVRERSHLPVLVDPVRAAGETKWVVPMCRAAIAGGAQGIILPVSLDAGRGVPMDTCRSVMAALRSVEE